MRYEQKCHSSSSRFQNTLIDWRNKLILDQIQKLFLCTEKSHILTIFFDLALRNRIVLLSKQIHTHLKKETRVLTWFGATTKICDNAHAILCLSWSSLSRATMDQIFFFCDSQSLLIPFAKWYCKFDLIKRYRQGWYVWRTLNLLTFMVRKSISSKRIVCIFSGWTTYYNSITIILFGVCATTRLGICWNIAWILYERWTNDKLTWSTFYGLDIKWQ